MTTYINTVLNKNKIRNVNKGLFYTISYKKHIECTLEWIVKLDDDLDLALEQTIQNMAQKSADPDKIYCHHTLKNMVPIRTDHAQGAKW